MVRYLPVLLLVSITVAVVLLGHSEQNRQELVEVRHEPPEPGTYVQKGLMREYAPGTTDAQVIEGLRKEGINVFPVERGKGSDFKPIPTKVELGKALFADRLLSIDGTRACIDCHIPARGFASGGLVTGVRGKKLATQAPTLINVKYGKRYFADGRAANLYEQCAEVLDNADEMGDIKSAVSRVSQVEKYAEAFARLYPDIERIDSKSVIDAIVSYELTITSGRGRFDDYLDAKPGTNPLTAAEVRGFDLFRGKAQCYRCHDGANLTDNGFHNTGAGLRTDPDTGKIEPFDLDTKGIGRANVTRVRSDYAAYKTPTLRAIGKRAPYFRDASFPTLLDVVNFYDKGGFANPAKSRDIFPLGLTPREKTDLVAFLRCL